MSRLTQVVSYSEWPRGSPCLLVRSSIPTPVRTPHSVVGCRSQFGEESSKQQVLDYSHSLHCHYKSRWPGQGIQGVYRAGRWIWRETEIEAVGRLGWTGSSIYKTGLGVSLSRASLVGVGFSWTDHNRTLLFNGIWNSVDWLGTFSMHIFFSEVSVASQEQWKTDSRTDHQIQLFLVT